jgi:hypothetical protein
MPELNKLRHLYLLAKGFYLPSSFSEGLRVVCSAIQGREVTIEEAFGLLLPQVWKSLVAAGEDKIGDATSLSPNVMIGGSTYEFASLFMFMRKLVFNLDKNHKIASLDEINSIVYTHWDELFAQSFLEVLMARAIDDKFLGEPDPTILPINQDRKKKGKKE